MSTTFNIIPTKVDARLTFNNVLQIAKQTLENQLSKFSISVSVDFSVNIHENEERYVNEVNLDSSFVWNENEYAWFKIDKSSGGTDAYCKKLSIQLSEWDTYIEDTLGNILTTPQLKKQVIESKYEWCFRRSAGQSPLVSMAYGHLAAAVANLTDGYIYTYDGAWHENIFPARAEHLLEVYFYPDKAKDVADYDWTKRCIEGIKSEFGSK